MTCNPSDSGDRSFRKRLPHCRSRLWGALLLTALVIFTLLVSPFPAVGAQVPVLVSIEPADQSVLPGQDFTCSIKIDGVENLGAFEFKLSFEPKILEVKGVSLGDFLASSGRQVAVVGPKIDNEGGNVSIGAFSLGSGAGPSGSGVLAVVAFKALKSGRSALKFVSITITDVDGKNILVSPEGGVVDVSSGAPTVTAAPSVSPTATATLPRLPTVTATPTATETAEPTATRAVKWTSTATSSPTRLPASTASSTPAPSPTTTVESTPVPTVETSVPSEATPVAGASAVPTRTTPAKAITMVTEGAATEVSPTTGQGGVEKVPTLPLPPTEAPTSQPSHSAGGVIWGLLVGLLVVVAALGVLYVKRKS